MTVSSETLDPAATTADYEDYYLDGTPPPEPFDAVFIRAQGGDGEAFADMWRRCQRSAYYTIRNVVGPDSAEDLTQHTAMKVFQYLPNFKLPEKQDAVEQHVRSWINVIAKHSAIDEIKRNKRRHDTWLSDMSFESLDNEEHRNPDQQPIGSPEAVVDDIASQTIVGNALKHLPAHYRAAVYAVDVEGRTPDEYAEAAGIKRGTVGSRLFRGRQLLRELVLDGAIDGMYHRPDAARTGIEQSEQVA